MDALMSLVGSKVTFAYNDGQVRELSLERVSQVTDGVYVLTGKKGDSYRSYRTDRMLSNPVKCG